MRTPERTFRKVTYLLLALTISAALAACGSGGGSTSSTSPGVAGPANVDILIAAADVTGSSAPSVAVSGADSVPSTDPGYLWPEQITQLDPRIEHVYMEVIKVSLMPSEEAFGSEDMDGDIQAGSSPGPASPPDKPNFLTVEPEPTVWIDLIKLENGKKLARLLNKFDQVPTGTYDKIRVYYGKVKVVVEDGTPPVYFHPTANSKFDIHFRQGHELVIPVPSDTTQKPDGWVKLFQVKLNVVGLKLKIVGQGKSLKGSKVILRPQIFAEFNPPILYSVAGTAMDVPANSDLTLLDSGTFNVSFGVGDGYPRIIPVDFSNLTTWAYSDNVLGNSSWIVNDVPDPTVVPIFRSGAKVMAIGPFDTSSLHFQATDIVFTFPDVRQGKADNVWIPPDNVAFIVRSLSDNVTVFPQPDRNGAYYDTLTSPHDPLDYTYIDNNLEVRARGYFDELNPLKLWSYWISIGGPYSPGP